MTSIQSCSYSNRLLMFYQSGHQHSTLKTSMMWHIDLLSTSETESTFHSYAIFKAAKHTNSIHSFMIIKDWAPFLEMLHYLLCVTDWYNLLAKTFGLDKKKNHSITGIIFIKDQQRTFRTSGAICYPREQTAQLWDNWNIYLQSCNLIGIMETWRDGSYDWSVGMKG